MRKIITRSIGFLLCVVVAIVPVYASMNHVETIKINNDDTALIDTAQLAGAEDISKFKGADITTVNKDCIQEMSTASVKDLISKSDVTIIEKVNQNEIKQLAECLNLNFESSTLEENQCVIGVAICKTADKKYRISRIIAEIADKETFGVVEKPSEEDAHDMLAQLQKNASIDMNEFYAEVCKTPSMIEETVKTNAITSATSNDISNSFGISDEYYYLYSTSSADMNYTEYDTNGNLDRYKIALIHIVAIGLKNQTKGTTTIDSFVGNISVTPFNELRVKEYHGELYTPELEKYHVLGGLHLETDSRRSISVELSTDIKAILGSIKYGYEYNTGGQEIINQAPYTAYRNRWKVTPVSPTKGNSYMIAPSMVVEVMNGTNTTCYAKAGISYIKVGPLGTANWVSSQLKYVNLKYKNHVQL